MSMMLAVYGALTPPHHLSLAQRKGERAAQLSLTLAQGCGTQSLAQA
jgi:hypothetical protein